jgi:hypothetical protein
MESLKSKFTTTYYVPGPSNAALKFPYPNFINDASFYSSVSQSYLPIIPLKPDSSTGSVHPSGNNLSSNQSTLK